MQKPIVVALFNPVNLAMLALSAAAGLCSAWWLFPAGLLLWAIMVIAIARHPSLQISHQIHSRAPLAPRLQGRFDRIERLQINFFNTLAAGSRRVNRLLQPVQNEMDDLTEQAYLLCQRTSALENYRVVSQNNTDLEAEWVNLSRQLTAASDPVVQRELKESLTALELRLDKQRRIVTQLDRVDAQLTSLGNAMEGVLAEVLRLQSMGEAQVKQNVPQLVETLRSQAQQLVAFSQEGERTFTVHSFVQHAGEAE